MKKYLLVSILTSLVCSHAFAGGYQLFEYSVTNLGRSFAGAGVSGDDYSAIAFNPAGMNFKGTGLQAGGSFVSIRSTNTGSLLSGDGSSHQVLTSGQGEIRTRAFLPHFFAQKQINDKFTLGTGIYVPFGLGTYYHNKSWFGATHALNSEINAIDFAVSASYKITDTVALGASVYAEKMEARLTNATDYHTESDMNADDWSKGMTFGITYEPIKDTRLGVAYRSKTTHNIKGTHYIHTPLTTLAGDCGTKLVLPEHIMLSAYQKVGLFGLSAMARWTRWSHFSKLSIPSEAYRQATSGAYSTLPAVNEDWRNVWMFSLGTDYYMDENWTLRTGLAFDQGAVKRAKTRTARVPDTNRWIASLGASYKKANWQVDLAYMRVFWKNAHGYNTANNPTGTAKDTLASKYHTGTDILGLAIQYNF